MKKLLFLMLVGIGGTMLIKNGQVTITPDNDVRVAGYAVPLPDAVKNSPLMGMVTTMLMGVLPAPPQAAGAPQFAGPTARPGATPVRPVLPAVTSVAGTYNANTPAAPRAPAAGPNMALDQFNAVSKALKGTQ